MEAGTRSVDRYALRALAEDALEEFQKGAIPDPDGFPWQEQTNGVWFSSVEISALLKSAIAQYSKQPSDQPDFTFSFIATRWDVKVLVTQFLQHFYNDIRDIICNSKRQTEAARLSRSKLGPTCAALSAFVVQKFGLSEPIAIGVGAYLLIVLLEATKGAFCKMGKQEVYDCVRNS